jgi:hypothetical protein
LRLCPTCQPSRVAIEAAVRVAQAFQSEIESLFIEEQQLIELARFPFAREISLTGRSRRALSPESIESEMRGMAASLARHIAAIARAADVPFRARSERGEAVGVLAKACAENGPWNVVALGEPLSTTQAASLAELFDAITDTTAIVVAGPKAQRSNGPVVATIEDLEHLPGMLRAAERLAAISGEAVRLLLVAESEEDARWMESQVRLMIGSHGEVKVDTIAIARAEPEVVAEALRRMRAGFVVALFGGLVVPREGSLRSLANSLEGPLFLVRP